MELTDHAETADRRDDDEIARAMDAGYARCRRIENPQAAYRVGFTDELTWGIRQLIGSSGADKAGVLIGSFEAFAAETCRSIHPKHGVSCARERHDGDAHFARIAGIVSHW